VGDGTEEQNLGERGNSATRIKKDEVDAAFGKKPRTYQSLKENRRGGVGGQRESHDQRAKLTFSKDFKS